MGVSLPVSRLVEADEVFVYISGEETFEADW